MLPPTAHLQHLHTRAHTRNIPLRNRGIEADLSTNYLPTAHNRKQRKMLKLLHGSHLLTSSPLLRFVIVRRFGVRVSGRREPICRCSAATWGLDGLCWRLSRRLVRGGVSFTAAWLMAELEATGKLFMLQHIRKYSNTLGDGCINDNKSLHYDERWYIRVCEGLCVYLECLFRHSQFSFHNREQIGM